MSRHFAGTSWKSLHFAGSHFRVPSVPSTRSGGSHWANSHFKTKQFATTHFRGEPIVLETGGQHWKNSQFKCRQFATRHFRGIHVPVGPPAKRKRGAWWANWGWPEKKAPVPQPVRVVPEEDEALAITVLEADELL